MKKVKGYSRVMGGGRAQESFSAPTGASSSCCSHRPVRTRRAPTDIRKKKEKKRRRKNQARACTGKNCEYPPQLSEWVEKQMASRKQAKAFLSFRKLRLKFEKAIKQRTIEKVDLLLEQKPWARNGRQASKLQKERDKMPFGQAKTYRKGRNAFGEWSS